MLQKTMDTNYLLFGSWACFSHVFHQFLTANLVFPRLCIPSLPDWLCGHIRHLMLSTLSPNIIGWFLLFMLFFHWPLTGQIQILLQYRGIRFKLTIYLVLPKKTSKIIVKTSNYIRIYLKSIFNIMINT